jgi:predicted nucleic acid-binding protein
VIVVCDASPLISLAAVQHLELLHQLYAEIVVPEAVHREMTANLDLPGAAEIAAARWIHVQPVHNRALVEALSLQIDIGEAAAIALAVETGADLLLMDERRGRRAATRLGQRVVGVLGVLVEAKERGYLPAVQPVLDVLVTGAGFRVSDTLHNLVLRVAGEAE